MMKNYDAPPSLNTKSQMMAGKVNHKGTFGPSQEDEFGSTNEMGDEAPKYIQTEDLEPLENAN
jgi:hypothetical protein